MSWFLGGLVGICIGWSVANIVATIAIRSAYEASDGWADSNRMWAEDVAALAKKIGRAGLNIERSAGSKPRKKAKKAR